MAAVTPMVSTFTFTVAVSFAILGGRLKMAFTLTAGVNHAMKILYIAILIHVRYIISFMTCNLTLAASDFPRFLCLARWRNAKISRICQELCVYMRCRCAIRTVSITMNVMYVCCNNFPCHDCCTVLYLGVNFVQMHCPGVI